MWAWLREGLQGRACGQNIKKFFMCPFQRCVTVFLICWDANSSLSTLIACIMHRSQSTLRVGVMGGCLAPLPSGTNAPRGGAASQSHDSPHHL